MHEKRLPGNRKQRIAKGVENERGVRGGKDDLKFPAAHGDVMTPLASVFLKRLLS